MGLAVGSSKLLFWKVSFWSEDCLLLFWCPSWCQSVDAWSYRLHVFRQGQCILVLFHRWMPATIWSRWHRRASRPTAHRGDPAVSVGGLQWQVTPLGEAPLPAGAASRENGFVATKIRTCWFLFVTWWSEDMNSKVPIVNPSFPMPVQYTWGQEFRWVKLSKMSKMEVPSRIVGSKTTKHHEAHGQRNLAGECWWGWSLIEISWNERTKKRRVPSLYIHANCWCKRTGPKWWHAKEHLWVHFTKALPEKHESLESWQ